MSSFPDSSVDDGRGPTKRRTLDKKTMRYGLRIQPAPASPRKRLRRIMSLRFRPAHISSNVINRRDYTRLLSALPSSEVFPFALDVQYTWRGEVCQGFTLSRFARRRQTSPSPPLSAHQSERKNILTPPQSRGLDKVAPYQYLRVISMQQQEQEQPGHQNHRPSQWRRAA